MQSAKLCDYALLYVFLFSCFLCLFLISFVYWETSSYQSLFVFCLPRSFECRFPRPPVLVFTDSLVRDLGCL